MREEKKRHGCLAAWLVLVIISGAFTFLSYLMAILGKGMMRRLLQSPIYQNPSLKDQVQQLKMFLNIPAWFFMILMSLAAFSIIGAAALFAWRKWGFWCFLASNVVMLTLNIVFMSSDTISIILQVAAYSLMALILFGVLHIGRENKGWPQLR